MRRIITAREQVEMLAPWLREAMPIEHIPPMQTNQKGFDRIVKQYDIDPRRAGISSQGGMAYTKKGEPGVMMSYVHRDEEGVPLGFLHYFPSGTRNDEPGHVTLMVHPEHRGKGIGEGLLNAALKEYGVGASDSVMDRYDWTPIDLENQRMTPSGHALYRKMRPEARTAQVAAASISIEPDPTGSNGGDAAHAWHGDKLVGNLTWAGKNTTKPGVKPTVQFVSVHPEYRRQGIATNMINWVRQNMEPNLDFNDWLSKSGKGLAESMGYTPKNWSPEEADPSDQDDSAWAPGGRFDRTRQDVEEEVRQNEEWSRRMKHRQIGRS